MPELAGRSLLPYVGAVCRRPGQLWHRVGLGAALLLVMAALVGCSTVVRKGEDVEISREKYRQFWSFTVERGTLKCLNATGRRQGEAILDAEGVTYALNEAAEKAGYVPIDAILADNPNFPGIKFNYRDFLALAVE